MINDDQNMLDELTFGVNCPITNGTRNPVVQATPLVSDEIGPEKFGLRSVGTTSVLHGIMPCAPTDRIKNNPASCASHPAYAAAIKKELSSMAAAICEKQFANHCGANFIQKNEVSTH